MYNIVSDYTLIDRNKWSSFVKNHQHSNFFQTYELVNFYSKTRYYTPVTYFCLDLEDNIVGVMVGVIQREYNGLLGLLSSRCIIMGGPVIVNSDNKNQILEKILSAYDEDIKKKAIYTQFRNFWNVTTEVPVYSILRYKYEEHLNILINISVDPDQIWKGIHSKRRNEIRKAEKSGLTFGEIKTFEDFEKSYQILCEVYKRAKLPIPEYDFFENAFKELNPDELFKCFGVYSDNKLIGTMYVFCYNSIIYDWYAGSHADYYKKCPNDFLPWELFKWGKDKGFKIFDFGGAGKPNVPYGVRDYKLKFGGELVNFGRLEKIHRPFLFYIAKIGFRTIQTLMYLKLK